MAEFVELAVRAAGVGKAPRTAPAWLLKPVAAVSAPVARALGFAPPMPPGVLTYLLWQARVDATKAQRELSYRPILPEEGIARTVDHLREQGLLAA